MRPKRAQTAAGYTYMVTSQTSERRMFLKNDRWARLFIEVLQSHRGAAYQLHAFVVMPEHFHALLTPKVTLERAVQIIKGGFSFRARRKFDYKFDIWQKGFSDHRIRDMEDFERHVHYIQNNPARAGLCSAPEGYPYGSWGLVLDAVPQRLKPLAQAVACGGAEAPPLQDRLGTPLQIAPNKNQSHELIKK